MVKRFPDLKVESEALEKILSIRVLELAIICVGDVICGRSELQYMQSRKCEISVLIS